MSEGRVAALAEAVAEMKKLGLDLASPGGAVALQYLLESGPVRQTATRPNAGEVGEASVERQAFNRNNNENGDSPAARVGNWLAVDVDRVLDVIEFGDDEAHLRIPAGRLPRSKADRQRVLGVLKLSLDRIGYDEAEVASSKVNAVCQDYGCLDQNLGHNLSARGDLVTRRGKRGAYVYRVSQPGVQKAHALLVELFGGEGALEL